MSYVRIAEKAIVKNYFETEGALKYSIIKDFIAKFYEVPAFKAEMYYHLCNNPEENERFRVFFRQELSNYVKQRNEYIEELFKACSSLFEI